MIAAEVGALAASTVVVAPAVPPTAFLGALGTPPSANKLPGEVDEAGESLSAGEEEEEEGVGVGD